MKLKEYDLLSEKEVIQMAKNNNQDAVEFLIKKYMNIICWVCKSFYTKGAEKEDLLQVALIAFHKAIMDYKYRENGLSVKNFVALCVRRELISFVKCSNRLKHQLLNNAIPVFSSSDPARENEEGSCSIHYTHGMFRDNNPTPEEALLNKELKEYIKQQINTKLSNLEKKVLLFRLRGYTYKEISMRLNTCEKTIDNSVQRVRKKLKKVLVELKAV